MTKCGRTWSASKRWNQGAMSHSQRSAQTLSRAAGSAKNTSTSRSLCSSAARLAMLPATDIPTTPDCPRKNATTRSRISWWLEGKELDSTADVQLHAGDVRGEIRAEEGDRVGDVLRLAGPPERRAGDHALVHVRVAEVERLRPDDARNDRVDVDSVARPFERERARQAEQAGLRRR